MRVLSARDTRDRAEWLTAWEAWPNREVFAHPGYLESFAEWSGGEPRCAVHDSDGGAVLYPFFLRPIAGTGYQDIASPYGYGGPFVTRSVDTENLAREFWSAFDRWCMEAGVVTEFIRFALPPSEVLPYPGATRQRALNVVRDLELTEESLWLDVKHKVRKNVKRAQRDGLDVLVDPTGERLDDFLKVYEATMDRRDADQSYYFNSHFFLSLHDLIPGQFCYFHALRDQEIVATELVLTSEHAIYSFLGGTDPAHFASRPNDLLKYEVCRWAQLHAKKRFVLGGGKLADDGIFQYKLAFAPNGAIPFHTGERVIDSGVYAQLVQGTRSSADDGFFPAYRAA